MKKAISKGDRVTYMGWSWCTGIVDDFDQDGARVFLGFGDVWAATLPQGRAHTIHRIHKARMQSSL